MDLDATRSVQRMKIAAHKQLETKFNRNLMYFQEETGVERPCQNFSEVLAGALNNGFLLKTH